MFFIASVCFNCMSMDARHGRRADHGNRETKGKIAWLHTGAVTEWERPKAAAQDANRRLKRWFCKPQGTRFLPRFPSGGMEKTASAGGEKSNHRLNDKPENPWYPKRVVREKRKRFPRREGEGFFKENRSKKLDN